MTDHITTRALLEQALEALEIVTDDYDDSAVGLEIDAIQALRAELAKPVEPCEAEHEDDLAVNRFAKRMKWKLANARARGKSGWQDRSWTPEQISAALRQHVDKGDPIDVANYCMFLVARGEPITPTPTPAWHDAPETIALKLELESAKDAYLNACKLVADMHAAAVGAMTGPRLGVVEDVAALKAERDAAMRDAERYRWLTEYLVSDDESYDDQIVAARTVKEIDRVVSAAIAMAEGGGAA